jgi:hypothetical protein
VTFPEMVEIFLQTSILEANCAIDMLQADRSRLWSSLVEWVGS